MDHWAAGRPVPAFLDSVEQITINRWWRYSEIERFIPERVKALDAAIEAQNFQFGGEITHYEYDRDRRLTAINLHSGQRLEDTCTHNRLNQ